MGVASMPDTLEKIYEERKTNIRKPLTIYGRLRYEHAISMMRSMDKHFLQLSVGVDGKRADHLVDLGKAIQSHNAAQTEDRGRLERIIDKVRGR